MAKFFKNISLSLDKFFEITLRGSTFQTEILAGISTFFSLSYILVVNPAILSKAGFNPSSVLFATAIASGLTTILMGIWARLPFVLAPGLEMNGFVVFSAIGIMGLSISQSLGAVFWSGILCIILTRLPIRESIINSIPKGLQSNLAFSVGIFVMTIGLFLAKLVIFNKGLPSSIGSFFSSEAFALYIGLILCLVIRGFAPKIGSFGPVISGSAFLIAIIISSLYCRLNGILPDTPTKISDEMLTGIGIFDIFPFNTPSVAVVFLVLFLIDFYGSIGKFIGLTATTNLRSEKNMIKGIEKAMYVDGIGTVGGAMLGTTSIITYVESAIGIQAGGRTGIVSIVCGVLMILSLVLTPLVALVPVVATSGILIYVGFALIPSGRL